MNERHNKHRYDVIVEILTHNVIKEELTQGSSPSTFGDSLIPSGKNPWELLGGAKCLKHTITRFSQKVRKN